MADINLTAEQVAALILSIGDKSKLKTADKQTIVDAINEVIDSNLAPTQTFLPIARVQSEDGAAYVTAGENLPDVNPGSNGNHAGKGKQIIFIPDDSSNTIESPTLQINGGDAVPIRMRAPKNQGQYESRPDATLPVPVGALMVGVPYTLTFCGKYWLVDSLIDLHTDSVTEADVETMIANAIGDTATALSDMDSVIGGAGA